MSKILIIEDNQDFRELLQNYLEDAGYAVAAFDDGVPGLEGFRQGAFDLVLVDIMLPQTDGYGVVEEIRKMSGVPVIMLTALDSEAHQLRGFELCIDDYVVKSVSMPVLLQKIAAVLRRTKGQTASNAGETAELSCRSLFLDIKSHAVTASGIPVDLTLLEFDILRKLLEAEGRVITRKALIEELWDYNYYGGERIVDTHIKNIRKKLGADDCIETVRGVGYKIPKAR
ncbi:MAG: response regulator transcription factor [Clostridiales bacterium]|jgi:two-component system response regulator VanR|nr:response regulator transcription factor [Clostridiales bacterium]